MAQWVKNPTSIHEDISLILGLIQGVKVLVWLQAGVQLTDAARILCCCHLHILQLQLRVDP